MYKDILESRNQQSSAKKAILKKESYLCMWASVRNSTTADMWGNLPASSISVS